MSDPTHPIPRHLVGMNTPSVRPGEDPALYGSATMEAHGPLEVRSYATITVTYTVGRLGLDDTGAIRLAFRAVTDFGPLQADDPAAPNHVTARCTGSGTIRLRIGAEGQRPFNLTVTAELRGGYLREGDRISITLGDTQEGSPGWLMQTFADPAFEIVVATDVQATGNFLPLAEQFAFPISPGPAAAWKAVLPTLRRPGEAFTLGLKAEDAWGNPTDQAAGRLTLVP